MVLVLKEGVPSFDKRRRIEKKATNVLADHLIRRKSQDRRGGRIGIQTSSRIIDDQYSVEHILEDRREFTICGPKSLVCFSMFSPEMPE